MAGQAKERQGAKEKTRVCLDDYRHEGIPDNSTNSHLPRRMWPGTLYLATYPSHRVAAADVRRVPPASLLLQWPAWLLGPLARTWAAGHNAQGFDETMMRT